MLLFYIRHGDPIYAPDQLTPLGRRQAEAVAKRLALYGVDQIYSSTSTRAYETALPTSELLKKPITQLHWCIEHLAYMDFHLPYPKGEATTAWCWAIPEVRELFLSEEVRALGFHWYDHPALSEHRDQFKGGMDRISKELYAFLAEHGYEHDGEHHCYRAIRPNDDRIALFAHEGFGKAFMSCLLDIPYPLYSTHFEMGHSGMTVIEFPNNMEKVIPLVLQLSNDSHIYREGLPTNYHNKIRF